MSIGGVKLLLCLSFLTLFNLSIATFHSFLSTTYIFCIDFSAITFPQSSFCNYLSATTFLQSLTSSFCNCGLQIAGMYFDFSQKLLPQLSFCNRKLLSSARLLPHSMDCRLQIPSILQIIRNYQAQNAS